MRLEVPYYKQNNMNDCGPTTLQMVLDYLGKEKHSREEIQNLVDSDKSGVTWTLGIAKAAAELGFKTEFYSSFMELNPENYKLDFYKESSDGFSNSEKKTDKLTKECLKLGVKMEQKTFDLDNLLVTVNKNAIPILLVDWGKIGKLGRFQGHFVPVVGYDTDSVIIHDPHGSKGGSFISIPRKQFDEIRKAPGTDQDIVIVHRK